MHFLHKFIFYKIIIRVKSPYLKEKNKINDVAVIELIRHSNPMVIASVVVLDRVSKMWREMVTYEKLVERGYGGGQYYGGGGGVVWCGVVWR